jgi:hypothetical protein
MLETATTPATNIIIFVTTDPPGLYSRTNSAAKGEVHGLSIAESGDRLGA